MTVGEVGNLDGKNNLLKNISSKTINKGLFRFQIINIKLVVISELALYNTRNCFFKLYLLLLYLGT